MEAGFDDVSVWMRPMKARIRALPESLSAWTDPLLRVCMHIIEYGAAIAMQCMGDNSASLSVEIILTLFQHRTCTGFLHGHVVFMECRQELTLQYDCRRA